MWKWLKETILVVAIVVLTTAGAAAAAPSLSDGAHLLTPAEQAEVSAALQDVEQRYDVRIAVVTVASTKGTKAGTYAKQLLDWDYRDGKNGNMVLLLAMDRHDWYVATDKAMKERISNKKGIPYLKDAFLPPLKDGHYAKAFEPMASRRRNYWLIIRKRARPMTRPMPSAPWPWSWLSSWLSVAAWPFGLISSAR